MIELNIFRGKEREKENKDIFEKLLRDRNEIEINFGAELEWEQSDDVQVCRIRKSLEAGGYQDEAEWALIHERMVDTLLRLQKALDPKIQHLKREMV